MPRKATDEPPRRNTTQRRAIQDALEHANRLRVGRSWSLVRDTRMPIGDISEVVGFESKSAFCRSFKARFGVTTSEVRRAAR